MKEYMNEIESMREKIMKLEKNNSSLRINFDHTISNLESRVEKQKEQKFATVMEGFKSELDKKDFQLNKFKLETEKYKNLMESHNVEKLKEIIKQFRNNAFLY